MQSAIKAAPTIFKCPFKGMIEEKNFHLPFAYFKFLPSGEYRMNASLSLNEDGKIYGILLLEFQVRNKLKEMIKV